MPKEALHRFEEAGKRFAIDPETCFCFECDEISWDVLEYYPFTSVNRICHLLNGKHDVKELEEVVGELEWLRSTKAILPHIKREDFRKEVVVEQGLKRLSVRLPRESTETAVRKKGWFGGATITSSSARDFGRDAIALLLGRSGDQKELRLEFLEEESVHNGALLADLSTQALKTAALAGKKLIVELRVHGLTLAKTPEFLEGHAISALLEFSDPEGVATGLRAFSESAPDTLPRLLKALQPDAPGVSGRIVIRPNHPRFSTAVEELEKAGFSFIELDLDGAYVANPSLDPNEMLVSLKRTAVYYAKQLLQQKYTRLDPIAPLFYRIYDGKPLRRADLSGSNEMAIDTDGGIYPSWRFLGNADLRIGSLESAEMRESVRCRFDEVGAATTGVCRRCWARNLCGGGSTAVHQALSGSFRKPHDTWCNAQRSWMASAVAAFNLLSSEGVNFSRMYGVLARTSKPSIFTLVKAAFRMTIGMRPIAEADAEMLMDWENWNTASYFLFNETGVFLASKYDREMDALHSKGMDQELLLLKRDGTPFGIVKLRPERVQGAARAWVYIHDPADYASEDVRKGFRTILKEASTSQSIRRVTVPAAAYESELQAFLEAVGFAKEGVQREALFIHDAYHDVSIYGLSTEQL
ncbi:MAG: SPASM domain-containing protein [Candidatus Hydrogenedentes bacterium]|nr:SPASM domain-containing protein [Candidatus Hydrogenedentota bacterium]